MNGLDWLIVALTAGGGWLGAKLGLWRTLLRLAAAFVAWSTATAVGGSWASSLADGTGLTLAQSEAVVLAACFVAAFALVTAVDGVVIRRVRSHAVGNHVDTWAGAVLGLVQALAVLLIVLVALVPLPWGLLHEALDNSVLADALLRWAPVMYEALGRAGLPR